MTRTLWKEVPVAIGGALWAALRERLGKDVSVYATVSDPDGEYGRPYMMTEVGVKTEGSEEAVYLLKCESWGERDYDLELNMPCPRWTEHKFHIPDGSVTEE